MTVHIGRATVTVRWCWREWCWCRECRVCDKVMPQTVTWRAAIGPVRVTVKTELR